MRRQRGAHLRLAEAHERGGWFFEPTVVADAAPGMRIYDEENFAPISGTHAISIRWTK